MESSLFAVSGASNERNVSEGVFGLFTNAFHSISNDRSNKSEFKLLLSYYFGIEVI